MGVKRLSFEDWLLSYYGIGLEEYSKLDKGERRAMRKEYDNFEEDDE